MVMDVFHQAFDQWLNRTIMARPQVLKAQGCVYGTQKVAVQNINGVSPNQKRVIRARTEVR